MIYFRFTETKYYRQRTAVYEAREEFGKKRKERKRETALDLTGAILSNVIPISLFRASTTRRCANFYKMPIDRETMIATAREPGKQECGSTGFHLPRQFDKNLVLIEPSAWQRCYECARYAPSTIDSIRYRRYRRLKDSGKKIEKGKKRK